METRHLKRHLSFWRCSGTQSSNHARSLCKPSADLPSSPTELPRNVDTPSNYTRLRTGAVPTSLLQARHARANRKRAIQIHLPSESQPVLPYVYIKDRESEAEGARDSRHGQMSSRQPVAGLAQPYERKQSNDKQKFKRCSRHNDMAADRNTARHHGFKAAANVNSSEAITSPQGACHDPVVQGGDKESRSVTLIFGHLFGVPNRARTWA